MTDKDKESRDFGYHSTMGSLKAVAVVLACIIGVVICVVFVFAFIGGIASGIASAHDRKIAEKHRQERIEDELKSSRKTCVYDFCKSPVSKHGGWMCSWHIGDRNMIPQSARRIRWKEGHTEETVQIARPRHLQPAKCKLDDPNYKAQQERIKQNKRHCSYHFQPANKCCARIFCAKHNSYDCEKIKKCDSCGYETRGSMLYHIQACSGDNSKALEDSNRRKATAQKAYERHMRAYLIQRRQHSIDTGLPMSRHDINNWNKLMKGEPIR